MINLPGEFIDDIEDLISSDDIKPKERYQNKKSVTVRAKKRITVESDTKPESYPEKTIYESVIPGTQTIFVKTWGCAHNNSDSEYMAGQLASYGYKLTDSKENADLWLLNSCTVKNPSEDTFRNEIESGMNKGKHVVVAGCVPQGAPKSDYLRGLSVIGVQQIDRVVEVVEETLKGHSVRLLQNKKVDGKRLAGARLALPKVRKNPLIEIIAINTGCLNQCTYCKTKHARGDLASYSPEEIVDRAKQAFAEGCCEIWLTSEDTGAYGRDIGTSLPELLWQLVEVIPEHCMLRVGMTNPPYILEHLEEVAKVLQHPRVYAFLHVPVQSGSDSVLGEMKREYCRKDFEHVVDFLRERVPGVTIATDIICGFPTETDGDFEETITLCEHYKFPSLFINQFFPRPGTPAAKMQRIPANLVKKRTKRLTELFNSYEPYAGREGQVYTVLVTEISHDKQHYVGHNKMYEQVLLPMRENLLGTAVRVRITKTTKFSMCAEILDEENDWTRCSKKIESKPGTIGNRTFNRYLGMALIAGFVAFILQIIIKFI
ncbi:threonylcarbamoyladenosine tRNA methylthiotransferase-like [Teleopsis dalmanni]|uniref:threonylcarbamoyladenosine tRNA methylthiotransferase-like n=1 Tax=Teleopsis dalmanni TaxID=139649 RepID=UPI0018CE7C78|nr:threonylcarbamoyladenosine tRNA methylthiotransferase-like [Teleopsis dalmanni]